MGKVTNREIRQIIAEKRILNPLYDENFKALFASESKISNILLSSLLESLIDKKVQRIQILKNEPSTQEKSKSVRFDISCTFNNGEEAEIEIQNCETFDDYVLRSVHYLLRGSIERLHKGKPYSSQKKYYQINLVNFTIFKDIAQSRTLYQLRRDKDNALLTDNLNVIYLELPKVPDPMTLGEKEFEALQSYEKWSIFLLHVDNPEYKLFVDKVAATQQEVRMAEKEIYRMSLRERFWRWQVSRENAREDEYVFKETRKRLLEEAKTVGSAEGRALGLAEGRAAGLTEGKAAGLAEGKALGLAEGKALGLAEGKTAGLTEGKAAGIIETARNMKNNGIAFEVIANCTGLPLKQIEAL